MTDKPFARGEVWRDAKGKYHLVASVHGKVGRTPRATLTRYDHAKDEHCSQRRAWTQTQGWTLISDAPVHEPSL